MQYVTDEAKELARLLDAYKAAGAQPVAWLKATTALIELASRLRSPKTDGRELIRAFEVGLVLRSRSDDFLKAPDDPLAAVVWKLLYRQTLDSRAAAGEAAKYIEAILKALGQAEADKPWSPYALVADLASRALELLAGEDDPSFEARPAADVAKAHPDCPVGREFLAAAARLLIQNSHAATEALVNVAQDGKGYAPLTDLVYYDWAWGMGPGGDRFRPANPDPKPEPNRPLTKDVVWRDKAGKTVGSPLRVGDRIPLTRFNVDVLLNLAVWKANREDAKQPAADLAALWGELAGGELPACRFGPELDPVDQQPLAGIRPHANYDRRETDVEADEWAATKRDWLRRKDVIEAGYAVRYWAANNGFLDYLFRAWGWVAAPPAVEFRFPAATLAHEWPVVPTLVWLAGNPQLKDGDPAILAKWWNEYSGSNKEATSDGTGAPSGRSPWHLGESDWITIGKTGCGKTWLDMAILHGIGIPRAVDPGLTATRGPGGIQFYGKEPPKTKKDEPGVGDSHEQQQNPEKDGTAAQSYGLLSRWIANTRTETSGEGEKADLTLASANGQLTTQLSVVIWDTAGGDYNFDRLWIKGVPTQVFNQVVKPRLKKAGAISIALDCGRLMSGAADPEAEEESVFLEHCEHGEPNTGLPGTPLALVLTMSDKLGLVEPLDGAAAVVAHSRPDREGPGRWFEQYSCRPEASRRIQLQFVTHRLRHRLWRLLNQALAGPINGQAVNRLTGVFLTCGLWERVGTLPAGEKEETGAAAYLDWVARHLLDRWKQTISGPFATDVWRGVGKVMDALKPQLDRLQTDRRRFESPFPKRRRAAYNSAAAILNNDLGTDFPAAADGDEAYTGNLPRVGAAITRYEHLVGVYRDAGRGVARAFPNRRLADWRG
jgi:hypothetical protein